MVLELTAVVISLNCQAQMGENQWSCLSKKTYKINKYNNIWIIIYKQGLDCLRVQIIKIKCVRYGIPAPPKKKDVKCRKHQSRCIIASWWLLNSYFCDSSLFLMGSHTCILLLREEEIPFEIYLITKPFFK